MLQTTKELAAYYNDLGLKVFSEGDPIHAESLLKKSYLASSEEQGILVNLGLALMQQGMDQAAERCYKLALDSEDIRTVRAANKNLGFIHLWRGEWEKGWYHHSQRFRGESFEKNQWKGDPLNGQPLLIWNDVGIGDLFQFIRYTKPLVERGENIVLACEKSQIELVKNYLNWPLANVINRDDVIPPPPDVAHIPLMSLISVLDPTTQWGRKWEEPTWLLKKQEADPCLIGLCWASNPTDRSMHHYKSTKIENLFKYANDNDGSDQIVSLQTDEDIVHQKYDLQPVLKNWTSTINLIAQCKHVHSVDTAIAHLAAGSMVPVELHLAAVHDWRWRGKGSLWYKNIRISDNYINSLKNQEVTS